MKGSLADKIVDTILEGDDDELLRQMGDVAGRHEELYRKIRAMWDSENRETIDNERDQRTWISILAVLGLTGPEADVASERLQFYGDFIYGDEQLDAMERTLGLTNLGRDELWALKQLWLEIYKSNEGLDESIKASAVRTHDGTVFVGQPGSGHIDPAMQANQAGKTWDDECLGFLTDDGRFVDRAEAELIGLKAGQLKPEISDPGMVHSHDFEWMESFDPNRQYHYEINCVSANGHDISDMVDQSEDIDYNTFFRNVPLSAVFDAGIGQGYYWTPAQAIVAGIDYHEVSGNRPLTLKKDWHVSYHRSIYRDQPCFYIQHSAIEYVFVKNRHG